MEAKGSGCGGGDGIAKSLSSDKFHKDHDEFGASNDGLSLSSSSSSSSSMAMARSISRDRDMHRTSTSSSPNSAAAGIVRGLSNISISAEAKEPGKSNQNLASGDTKNSNSKGELEEYVEEGFDIENEEYEVLKSKSGMGGGGSAVHEVSTTLLGAKIAAGFKIVSMSMKDGSGGELLWTSTQFADIGMHDDNREVKESIPKRILKCSAVMREIVFSSREEINKFRIEQRVFLHGTCIEEWFFTFGFVIPGSTNSWEQVIEAAEASDMIPAEVLSGNVTFETSFFDDNLLICKNSARIYYV